MGPFGVVGDEPVIEHLLHLVDGFEPCLAAIDAEVLVKHGAMEALDDAIGLRLAHLGGSVLDLFELQEEFVGMLVGPPAELTAIIRREV